MITRSAISLIAATVAFTACQQRELCFDHDEHALNYHVKATLNYQREWHEDYSPFLNSRAYDASHLDWLNQWPEKLDTQHDDLIPGLPEGVGVAVFHNDGSRRGYNIDSEGGVIYLNSGANSMIFYSNDTEYIVLEDDNDLENIKARTRSRGRDSYTGSPYSKADEEVTVNQPDMIYVGFVNSIVPIKSSTPFDMQIDMKPLVCTYLIHFEINHGREHVALARGALSGMAASAKLFDGSTSNDLATILFDCNLTSTGAEAVVNSFGIPKYKPGKSMLDDYAERIKSDSSYGLNLELLLKNGKIVKFDFNVTDRLKTQPSGGVILVKDINISDDDIQDGSSGFDVNVNGWGEYQDYDLPL